MEDQVSAEVTEIAGQLKEQILISHIDFTQESSIFIKSLQHEVDSFFVNEKKVLLILSQSSDLLSSCFKFYAQKLWKQEQCNNIIPLCIELARLKNPFNQLIKEGLSLYGLTQEQQKILLKSNPSFILILIGYEQLKIDRSRNLYVTNKLEKFNIQKIVITCHSDYIKFKKNHRLFFVSYQNKEPQHDKLQEVNLDKIELTSSMVLKEEPEIKPIDDNYWHRMLTDDLQQLLSMPQIRGYKQPLTLSELQFNSLNKRLLVGNEDELNSRVDKIRQANASDSKSKSFLFKQLCFLFLRYSKFSDSVAVGAANAITLLNKARISFSGMDLSYIRIPYANLRYAIMDGANLEGANLQQVILADAFLRKTNLNNADMKGVIGRSNYPTDVRCKDTTFYWGSVHKTVSILNKL